MTRYVCDARGGKTHSFTLRPGPTPAVSEAPLCPDHGLVPKKLDGTYGKTGERGKQMYQCKPKGEKPHSFTWSQPRDHVHTGVDECAACEEKRGTHHGDRVVARGHTWPERVVVSALKDLAGGATYAKVSRDAWRATGRARTRKKPDGETQTTTAISLGSELSANRWHTAADWVEVFAPVLWDHLEPQLKAADVAARARSDAALTAGLVPDEPVVLLVDGIPIKVRRRHSWHILVAALVRWHPTPDPMSQPRSTVELRLVRGMAASDNHAWRLLFNEWGSTPDYVLADAETSLMKAVADHWGSATTVVPSLFHLRRAVTRGLVRDTPGAAARGTHNDTPVLLPELDAHLLGLRRARLTTMSVSDWTGWWDDLEHILIRKNLPIGPTRNRRASYEGTVANLLPVFRSTQNLPMSSGGLEVALRQRVEPLFVGRAHAFSNAERVNRLFDLAVCADHGMFDNPAQVADLLRADNAKAFGWATPLRAVADPRAGGRYSSLKDAQLLRDRARKAGLV